MIGTGIRDQGLGIGGQGLEKILAPKSYRDLEVWQKAMDLLKCCAKFKSIAVICYKIEVCRHSVM